MPERATPRVRWSEESAEAVVAEDEIAAKGRTWRKVKRALVSEVAMPQKSRQLELPFEEWGEAPLRGRSVEATTAAKGSGHLGSAGTPFVLSHSLQRRQEVRARDHLLHQVGTS